MKRLENRRKDIQKLITTIKKDLEDNKKARDVDPLSITPKEHADLFTEMLQLADLKYLLENVDYSKLGER